MNRAYNFSAGPAMLPEEILKKAQAELLNWQQLNVSVMELGHRTPQFADLILKVKSDLRHLLAIPENYDILFCMAPARAHYAMVPTSLLGFKKTADYLDTGFWSRLAIQEAQRFCEIKTPIAIDEETYTMSVPDPHSWRLNSDAAYVHYVMNETVDGLEFPYIPETGNIPLVSDITSTILSRPLDIAKFGVLYAGTQKNMGPAGTSIVIIRKDLIQDPLPRTSTFNSYQYYAKYESLGYTPATFVIYMVSLMLDWVKQRGGLTKIAEVNERKAQKLYDFIDQSDFYTNHVHKPFRSWMNIVFMLDDPAKEIAFSQEAQQAGLFGIRGHRYKGGLRASLYNAMPEEGVDALVDFMQQFSDKTRK